MRIAIAYSPNWKEYVTIEVYAIFSTNPPPVKIYLLSDTAGRMDLSGLCRDGYSVEFIDMEKIFNKTITSNKNIDTRFTKYTLYRLLLLDLIEDDRLLYIDADAIVNGDLTDFYTMDLGDNIVAGVPDIGAGADRYNLKAPLGIPEDGVYINAGVTLMDLGKIREQQMHKTWIKEMNSKLYPCHDQDVMNMTCQGRIKLVGLEYNVSLSTGLDIDPQEIKIMHYAGRKPWNTSNVPNYQIWEHWATKYDEAAPKIPKKIHYCWFGGRPKPQAILDCMASWREHMPDYEIIEWNESNFDTNCCQYVKQAYKSGKMAFVTDYVRLWALYNFGGIYMDGDVKVLKPLDRFLCHHAFTGHETDDLMVTAVLGAEAGHPWIWRLLWHYERADFVEIPNTRIITDLSKGLVCEKKDGYTFLRDGVVIYPTEFFCSYDHVNLKPMPVENSYALHLFCGTWLKRTKV